jgi:hypothetical protein
MRSTLTVWGLWFIATAIRAESLPTFHPGYSSHKATHIVLVKTEEGGQGKFRVVESWKGDLKPDSTLTISGLAKEAKGDMVLFLRRDKVGEQWKPAGIGTEWRVAVAWLDGDTVSAVEQENNPGPAEVQPLSYIKSRKEFRQIVDYYVNTDRAFEAAKAIKDPQKRVAAFEKIINGNYDRKEEAFAELGLCGPKAVPVLRKLLEGKPTHDHKYAVAALARAGGRDIAVELAKIIESEVTWWAENGPKLEKGWWFNTDSEAWKRHGRLFALIEVYRDRPTTEMRKQVVAVRDLMRNLPVVDTDRGIASMSAHCDKVLKDDE